MLLQPAENDQYRALKIRKNYMPLEPEITTPSDFDFIMGDWRVEHKRLDFRLVNCLK
jgi:hypothetical protein